MAAVEKLADAFAGDRPAGGDARVLSPLTIPGVAGDLAGRFGGQGGEGGAEAPPGESGAGESDAPAGESEAPPGESEAGAEGSEPPDRELHTESADIPPEDGEGGSMMADGAERIAGAFADDGAPAGEAESAQPQDDDGGRPETPGRPSRDRPWQKKDEESPYSDDDLKRAYEKVKEGKKVEVPILPWLRKWISREAGAAAMSGDYDLGQELDDVDAKVADMIVSDVSLQREEARQKAEKSVTAAKAAIQEINDKWDGRIAQYREEQGERTKALEQRHQQEWRELEDSWSTGAKVQQFDKPTPAVLQIRRTEKAVAYSKDFRSAKEMRALNQAAASSAAEERKAAASLSMKHEFARLDQKQNREMEIHLDYIRSCVELREGKRRAELAPYEKILARCEPVLAPPEGRDHSRDGATAPARVVRPVREQTRARQLKSEPGLGIGGPEMEEQVKKVAKVRKSQTARPNTKR